MFESLYCTKLLQYVVCVTVSSPKKITSKDATTTTTSTKGQDEEIDERNVQNRFVCDCDAKSEEMDMDQAKAHCSVETRRRSFSLDVSDLRVRVHVVST